jgi:hypothetical protein
MAPPSFAAAALLALSLVAPGSAESAITQVSVESTSNAPVFDSETLQVTDASLSTLNKNQSAYFAFAKNDSSLQTRTFSNGCKVFPGDWLWPSNWVWSLFDDFLDGALIKTVPLAASCYKSWPQYNAETCETLTSDWTNSNIQ